MGAVHVRVAEMRGVGVVAEHGFLGAGDAEALLVLGRVLHRRGVLGDRHRQPGRVVEPGVHPAPVGGDAAHRHEAPDLAAGELRRPGGAGRTSRRRGRRCRRRDRPATPPRRRGRGGGGAPRRACRHARGARGAGSSRRSRARRARRRSARRWGRSRPRRGPARSPAGHERCRRVAAVHTAVLVGGGADRSRAPRGRSSGGAGPGRVAVPTRESAGPPLRSRPSDPTGSEPPARPGRARPSVAGRRGGGGRRGVPRRLLDGVTTAGGCGIAAGVGVPGTYMKGSKLAEADLYGANLDRADLRGARARRRDPHRRPARPHEPGRRRPAPRSPRGRQPRRRRPARRAARRRLAPGRDLRRARSA